MWYSYPTPRRRRGHLASRSKQQRPPIIADKHIVNGPDHQKEIGANLRLITITTGQEKGTVTRITVNGKVEEIQDGQILVSGLLRLKEMKQPETVSVELNSGFLDRKAFRSAFAQ
jgi:hypothetical protein